MREKILNALLQLQKANILTAPIATNAVMSVIEDVTLAELIHELQLNKD